MKSKLNPQPSLLDKEKILDRKQYVPMIVNSMHFSYGKCEYCLNLLERLHLNRNEKITILK